MEKKGRDNIIETMEEVCGEQQEGDKYFIVLQEMYNHIVKYDRELDQDRALSMKKILDRNIGER